MTQKPLPPFPSRRRKVSVEVYFVLYLSAIVLLLGTSTTKRDDREAELEEAIVQLLAPDFRVDAERAALLYRFIPAGYAGDTSGVQLNRDSINTIRARGSFSEVEFSIVGIQDTASGQQLPLQSATLTRQGDRAVAFTWRPRQTTENAVYRVTVAAVAIPLPPSNTMRPELRERITEILQRHRVTDSVTFTVNVFAVNSLAMNPTMPPTNLLNDTGSRGATSFFDTIRTVLTPSASLSQTAAFLPRDPEIRTVSRARWNNTIIASGVTSPTVVSRNAQITSITEGRIELSGIAPATGEQQVVVEGIQSDGRKVTAQFTVSAAPLDPPNLPRVFFPDNPIPVDFSSNKVSDGEISVDVYLNQKKIIDRRDVNTRFIVTPKTTGQLLFQRYVGNTEMDKFTVDVAPIPVPRVGKPEFKVQSGEDVAIVQTTSFGMVGNQDNLAELKIEIGNAEEPELISTKTDGMEHIRTWRIRRRDNNSAFNFSIYAIDRRGSGAGKSKPQPYTQQ
jgi:hypothetical protein